MPIIIQPMIPVRFNRPPVSSRFVGIVASRSTHRSIAIPLGFPRGEDTGLRDLRQPVSLHFFGFDKDFVSEEIQIGSPP